MGFFCSPGAKCFLSEALSGVFCLVERESPLSRLALPYSKKGGRASHVEGGSERESFSYPREISKIFLPSPGPHFRPKGGNE